MRLTGTAKCTLANLTFEDEVVPVQPLCHLRKPSERLIGQENPLPTRKSGAGSKATKLLWTQPSRRCTSCIE